MTSLDVFNKLKENNLISDYWKYVLVMLGNQYAISEKLMKLFCLFFSLIDDGNICISLDAKILKEKWAKKIQTVAEPDDTNYDKIIDDGILEIKKCVQDVNSPLIIQYDGQHCKPENNLFVVHNNWLFTDKFFNAKQTIKQIINSTLFFKGLTPAQADIKTEAINITNHYKYTKKTSDNKSTEFVLSPEQANAITRAKLGQNLIITGGPGTGKTTIVCYLLLELLSQNCDSKIYMAAPSGKAAKRMKESITDSLDSLKEDIKAQQGCIINIINNVKPLTIHSLLMQTGINSHEIKKMPANSIFIIDEASMIDVCLFAKLMDVISNTENPRVFILGDHEQLPSVQPGAVFCDLTAQKNDCLIALTKTHRFPEGSEIYEFKQSVQNQITGFTRDKWEPLNNNWGHELGQTQKQPENNNKKYPVKYLSIESKEDIKRAVTQWYDAFYNNQEYQRVYSDLDLESPTIVQTLDAIWTHIEDAKILCAENRGIRDWRSTEQINKIICEYIKSQDYFTDNANENDFFTGEQIIITKNQHLYDLSNGDIGVLVSLNNKKYIMIKRILTGIETNDTDTPGHDDIIKRKGDYIFYPSYLLSSDSVEAAYAITIHKSQGSEYNNILVFLPQEKNSPLLNRQILYTAITRTKNATYIVSDMENIDQAICTPVERDTQLFL